MSRPQDLAEAILAASNAQHTQVIVTSTSHLDVRWAANELTTNGHTRAIEVTVIAVADGRVGTLTAAAHDADPRRLADRAHALALAAEPAWDAGPPVPSRPTDGAWAQDAAEVAVSDARATIDALASVMRHDAHKGREHFGYLEQSISSTWLATSDGLALRQDQPAARLELTVKSHDRTRSTWQGWSGNHLRAADVAAMAERARTELGWQASAFDILPGRHPALLSPSAVADLMIDLLYGADVIAAAEGRSVFSGPAGGTRIGNRLSDRPLRLYSDPALPGHEGARWLHSSVSNDSASVFDNGLPLAATDWIHGGRLAALVSTRASARANGVPLALEPDNLALDAGGSGGLDDLVSRTNDGLLITCTWYNRMVDPATHLITGLTRDGVYLVRGGEVVGAVGNFRFNCSPVALLQQIGDASAPTDALGREMADYFTRTRMPALAVESFNFSSASEAV